jgi:hypothetical protein
MKRRVAAGVLFFILYFLMALFLRVMQTFVFDSNSSLHILRAQLIFNFW